MTLDPSKDPNAAYRMRLGQGDRIRVLLSQKPQEQIEQEPDGYPDDDGFMLGPDKDDELIPKKKGIRFFDISQIFTDPGYERLDHYFIDSPHTGGPDAFIEPTGGSFFSDLTDLVLGIDRKLFPKYYKQIKNGTNESQIVQITYTDDDLGPVTTDLLTCSKFKNGKLMLSRAEAATLGFGMNNVGFSTGYDIMTLNPDIMDTDVQGSFTQKNNADIYLMPQVIQQFALSSYRETPWTYSTYGAGGYFFFDRGLWANYLTYIFMSSGYAKDWYGANNLLVPNSVPHTYNFQWGLDQPFTHWVYSEPVDPINLTYFNSSGPITVSGTPPSGAGQYGLGLAVNFGNYTTGHQGLRAVIKQNGRWYYLWDNTGTIV